MDSAIVQSAPVVPAREFRLVIEGLERWVRGIGEREPNATSMPSLGWLEGDDAGAHAVLVEALVSSCRALGIRCVSVDCSAEHIGILEPVRQLLEELSDWSADDSAALAARAEHQDALAPLGVFGGERLSSCDERPVAPPLLPPAEILYRAADCLAAATVRVPTVVVLERLDGADEPTFEFARYLARILAEPDRGSAVPRLLVVATSTAPLERCGLIPPSPAPDRSLAFSIRVRGYSREDVGACAERAGIELSVSERESIYRATSGRVSGVRHLLGSSEGRGDARSIALSLDAVPKLLASEYERLDPAARAAAIALAALGAPVRADRLRDFLATKSEEIEGSDDPRALPLGEALVRLASRGRVFRIARRSRPGSDLIALDPELRRVILGVEPDLVVRAWERRWIDLLFEGDISLFERSSWLACFLDGDLPRGVAVLGGASDGRDAEKKRLVALLLETVEGLARLSPEAALELLEKGQKSIASWVEEADQSALESRWLELLEETGNYREALDARLREVHRPTSSSVQARAWGRIARLAALLDEKQVSEDALGRARTLVGDDAPLRDRVVVRIDCADAALSSGERELAWECLGEARELATSAGDLDSPVEIELLDLLERVAFERGDRDAAERFELELLERRESAGDAFGIVRSLSHLGALAGLRGERTVALARYREARERAEESGSLLLLARTERRLGAFLLDSRALDEAWVSLRRALRVFRRFGDVREERRVEHRLLELELRRGRFTEAAAHVAVLTRAFDSKDGVRDERTVSTGAPIVAGGAAVRRREKLIALARFGDRDDDRLHRNPDGGESSGLVEPVRIAIETGALDTARTAIERGLARVADEAEGRSARAILWLYRGRLEALRGRTKEAAAAYERSLKAWPLAAERGLLAEAWVDVGVLLGRLGQLDRGFDHLVRGLRLALDQAHGPAIAHALLGLGGFLAEADALEPAAALATAASAIARAQGNQERELRAAALLVRAALGRGDRDTVERVLERGRHLDRVRSLPIPRALFRLEEAWVAYRRANLARAMELARGAVEIARSLDLRPLLAETLLLVACIDGHPDNPRRNVVRALESLEKLLLADEARASPRFRFEVLRATQAFFIGRGKEEVARAYDERAALLARSLRERLPPELANLSWGCRPIRHFVAMMAEVEPSIPS